MAENTLVDKILALQDKYNQLQNQLSDPEVIADMKKYVQLNKDYKELQPIIKAGLEYKKLVDELAEAKDHTARLRTKALINLLSIFHLRDSLLGNGPDARAAEPIPAPFIR